MAVTAIIGAQWGDEGKGKIVDLLAEKASLVVRFSGGDNAGHTVINKHGKFALHLVPSGIFSPLATCVIASGVVINPAILIGEIDDLNQRGVDTSRLKISDRAHLIMPYHIMLDGLEEEARGGKAIGTTRRGIGPAYADKAARRGIRAGDLLDEKFLRERIEAMLEPKNALLTRVYNQKPLSLGDIYDKYRRYGQRLAQHITDVTHTIDTAMARGDEVLLEGAQGTMLDIDFGTYPYTTSSTCTSGGAAPGAGIPPTRINRILGVYKAYCSRVGAGPFPTEMEDATGNRLRERAHEYGATTGRARRCGWFDGVAARYSSRINGFTGAVITRLDVLDEFDSIKICTGYRLRDEVIDYFPAGIAALEACQPIYEELPGWQTPTTHIRQYADLPPNARAYVCRIKEIVGCPIAIISIGAERDETIWGESQG